MKGVYTGGTSQRLDFRFASKLYLEARIFEGNLDGFREDGWYAGVTEGGLDEQGEGTVEEVGSSGTERKPSLG